MRSVPRYKIMEALAPFIANGKLTKDAVAILSNSAFFTRAMALSSATWWLREWEQSLPNVRLTTCYHFPLHKIKVNSSFSFYRLV